MHLTQKQLQVLSSPLFSFRPRNFYYITNECLCFYYVDNFSGFILVLVQRHKSPPAVYRCLLTCFSTMMILVQITDSGPADTFCPQPISVTADIGTIWESIAACSSPAPGGPTESLCIRFSESTCEPGQPMWLFPSLQDQTANQMLLIKFPKFPVIA